MDPPPLEVVTEMVAEKLKSGAVVALVLVAQVSEELSCWETACAWHLGLSARDPFSSGQNTAGLSATVPGSLGPGSPVIDGIHTWVGVCPRLNS